MTAWTVQCGSAAYYANTVTVEADTLDDALDNAIEMANNDASWKSLDHCGPTFIDAVAEGADADPWLGYVSAIPVPEQFTEGGTPPLIIVAVSGGVVQHVAIENGPARVIVRDYDRDGTDPATLHTDDNGDHYARVDWSTELPPAGGLTAPFRRNPAPPAILDRSSDGAGPPPKEQILMQLTHIELGKLSVAAVNMRHGKKAPDVTDILSSVRVRGILVPLLVRPNGSPETFEIVAGRRRYFAARAIADEQGGIAPLPCAVMEPGDDAAALEASLIENIARLDPDEVAQWETFTRLVKEGRSIAEISTTFGITERMVSQRLALGNLLPKIRDAYRNEEVDAETIRYLTLATKVQQKEWLSLFADPESHAPRSYQLKQWLFGGQSVATKVALFPVMEYPGQIVSDLFGEDSYFADTNLFWQKQNEAIAAKRDTLTEAGWSDVVILEPGEHFRSWEYEKTPKKKDGKVFVTVSHRGEVEIHEGYLSRKEARRTCGKDKTEALGALKPLRPEVTSTLQTYIDLHRHAAVRTALLDHPGAALRLMVAHAITGSGLWSVKPEPQQTRNEAVAASLAASASEAAFTAKRNDVFALLGFSGEEANVSGGNTDDCGTAGIFARLLTLSDDDVLRVLAIVMGEILEAGSSVVEAVGIYLKVNMGAVWQPDDAFFNLIRDRQVVNAMVAEVAGKRSADANIAEKVTTQKDIIRACLTGTSGRTKVESWLPGWMQFPVRAYTDRGGLRTAEQWARVRPLFAE